MRGARTELSPSGWRVAFAAVGLWIVGAALSNLLVLAIASLLPLYLLIEGTAFHRSTGIARQSLSVKTSPQAVKCVMGEPVEIESVISNHSNLVFRIIGLCHTSQTYIEERTDSQQPQLLMEQGTCKVTTKFDCKTPGQFEIAEVKVTISSLEGLFMQSILLADRIAVVAQPPIDKRRLTTIDSAFLDDLTSDHLRRGTGTDLAGMKPSTVMDDLHRIDWKATARTGKLMVREFYLEKQPAVMLLIDVSQTMNAPEEGKTVFSSLLTALPSLLESFRAATPIGLIMYTEESIIVELQAQGGPFQKNMIMRSLLSNAGLQRIAKPIIPQVPKDISSKIPLPLSISERQVKDLFNPSLRRISWFYRDAWLRRRKVIQKEGSFLAFAKACDTSESSLIIALTDGKTNLDGLVEGARNAAKLGNRVMLAVLTRHQRIPLSYHFPELLESGVKMQECTPEELPSVINVEITRMARERMIHSRVDYVNLNIEEKFRSRFD